MPCHYANDCSNERSYENSCKENHCRNCVPAFSIQSRRQCSIVCPPRTFNHYQKRIYSSKKFRLFYERGDLPCTIRHITRGQTLKWFIDDFQCLNIDFYLPIFVDGLCETKYPYCFIALQGVLDLIERVSNKIGIETLSKMIAPLKRALYTNDLIVIQRVLLVLQKLVRGNEGAIGIALVPYFNQLLPIINILKERYGNRNYCDHIDDNQNDFIRLIDQTLVILEQFGGPDAFINIKYSIPTYEQQVDVKQLSLNQMNTLVQPLLEL